MQASLSSCAERIRINQYEISAACHARGCAPRAAPPGERLVAEGGLSGAPRDQGQPTNLTAPVGHQEETQLVLIKNEVTPQLHLAVAHWD